MIDLDKIIKKSRDFLESEEGKEHMKNFALRSKQESDMLESQLDRFHAKCSNPELFSNFIEKVINKYESKKYRDNWYGRGIEPREDLFYFLSTYAEKYGRDCNEKEMELYGNEFTGSLNYIHGYYFNLIYGQGSAIHVIKEKEEYKSEIEKWKKDLIKTLSDDVFAIDKETFIKFCNWSKKAELSDGERKNAFIKSDWDKYFNLFLKDLENERK